MSKRPVAKALGAILLASLLTGCAVQEPAEAPKGHPADPDAPAASVWRPAEDLALRGEPPDPMPPEMKKGSDSTHSGMREGQP